MTIALAIIGLGLLIFVHELGHFVASLALGMRPRKFYVGFPPALVKTTRGGIEYGLGSIPLGGFVKIPGMHRPTGSDADNAVARALEEVPQLGPSVARLHGALAAGDHNTARDALRVLRERVAEAELSPAAARQAERSLDDLDDALGPDAYWRAATWRRVVAIAAGPVANILLAVVIFAVLFMTTAGRATTTVEETVPGSPAATIGLEAGDRIVVIDGRPVEARDVARTISDSEGQPLTIVVVRGGERVTLGPVAARPTDDGSYRLGFVLRGEGLGPIEAVGESLRVTAAVTAEVGKSVVRLVGGEGREDIASPVGIVQGSSDAAKEGADTFLFVLGLISLSIALLNLLPLLPLDGGHIVFAVLEGVRGRAVGREVYERVSIVGIGLVLVLFFIGLNNDIDRLS
jgi:regulator of sigma E protease